MLLSWFSSLTAFTVEDLRQRRLTNSLGHSALLMGGTEEEESYKMQQ